MEDDIVASNPMLKKPIIIVLELAEKANTRLELEKMALDKWRDSFARSPAAIIDMLARNGYLHQQSFVNGELYEGTLEDMQLDESVDDDAVVEVSISPTEAGRRLARTYGPIRTLKELFSTRARYADIFTMILQTCASENGCTRDSLEKLIDKAEPHDEDGKKVYPQFFLDALEAAGGIEWDGKWYATSAAQQLQESL